MVRRFAGPLAIDSLTNSVYDPYYTILTNDPAPGTKSRAFNQFSEIIENHKIVIKTD